MVGELAAAACGTVHTRLAEMNKHRLTFLVTVDGSGRPAERSTHQRAVVDVR